MDLILGQLHKEELGDNGTNAYCINVGFQIKKVKVHLANRIHWRLKTILHIMNIGQDK
jgi:hypothetical protein